MAFLMYWAVSVALLWPHIDKAIKRGRFCLYLTLLVWLHGVFEWVALPLQLKGPNKTQLRIKVMEMVGWKASQAQMFEHSRRDES